MSVDQVFETIEKLQEVNPMLGFRGCRLGITYPEITEMQVRCGLWLAGLGLEWGERGLLQKRRLPCHCLGVRVTVPWRSTLVKSFTGALYNVQSLAWLGSCIENRHV